MGQLVNMRDKGFISAHDFLIASLIADVVTGGDVDPGTLVNEAYLMTPSAPRLWHAVGAPGKRKNASWACSAPASPCATDGGDFFRNTQHDTASRSLHVAATRTPIGRSHRGYLKTPGLDDLLASVLRAALAQVPGSRPRRHRRRGLVAAPSSKRSRA